MHKLQELINTYIAADLAENQEAELRRILSETDESSLSPGLAADVRLVRILMKKSPDIPLPIDYKNKLQLQLDSLPRRRRIKWLWGGMFGAACAAAVLWLLFSVTPIPEPACNRIISHTASLAHVEPLKSLAAKQSRLAIETTQRHDGSGENITHKMTKGNIETDNDEERTEYYNPAEINEPRREEFADAPIIIRTENGEAYTYTSLEQSPEACAMIEQAFRLISSSDQMLEKSIEDYRTIMTDISEADAK